MKTHLCAEGSLLLCYCLANGSRLLCNALLSVGSSAAHRADGVESLGFAIVGEEIARTLWHKRKADELEDGRDAGKTQHVAPAARNVSQGTSDEASDELPSRDRQYERGGQDTSDR